MIRTRKSNKRKAALTGNKPGPTNNFLAASRKMNWFTVGASIFASNLGSEHFIGLSGSAAANGISVAAFELNALVILQLATWIFMPVLIVSKISTLPEYMSKRFGGKRIRTYLAVLSILLYIFTKISVNLFSGGIFLQQAIGWNLYTSAMFVLCLTSIMTLTGGLKGAMVIDNLQAVVMTVGASIVATKALVAIGGWEGLKQKYPQAYPQPASLSNLTQCGRPNPRAFQMLRPLQDRDMPWLGFIVGQTPASVWYWAADQMMVQRFLSARSLAHVQGSAVFAGYLKILPLVLMVIPGMISRCLYKDEVACIDPEVCRNYCQSSVSCSNTAYPRLVLELMPMGARGMMVAAMVAALMGDLCNVFNSASALFSCDVWPLFRKHATQKEQETAGRVFVICLVVASIMWIPVIQEMQGGQLFIYIQAVAAMFAPPIAGVYCCAVLWCRTNETGAFWSLMIGFVLGFTRMTMSFMYKEPSCGQHVDDRPWLLHVHYMYYAAFLFWITIGCAVLISLLTKPLAPFRLIRTTFWTRFDTNIRKDDKNVFELKSSTSKRAVAAGQSSATANRIRKPSVEGQSLSSSASDAFIASSNSSQQRLFTIQEQQEKKADLSSVVVDISKAANENKRGQLQHQASLSASASAAVGAASEAGKLLASKLANEVNLKGAKEMVKAAANHLTGPSSSRIRFENLEGDDDDSDDVRNEDLYEDSSDRLRDGDEDDDEVESTMEEEDSDFAERRRQHRGARASQSVLSAALNSYKQKQKGGYQKAANEDDDEEEEEEDENDHDELIKLNRSSSLKVVKPDKSGEKSACTTTQHKRSQSTRRIHSGKGRPRAGAKTGQPGKRATAKQDCDQETGKIYKCLDNSVSLLMKTRFEEAMLRIAVVAIMFVAIGIFTLFSLPPRSPPEEVVKFLNETS